MIYKYLLACSEMVQNTTPVKMYGCSCRFRYVYYDGEKYFLNDVASAHC